MKAARVFVVVLGAAAALSACAVLEFRPVPAQSRLIDAGITGNPNVAHAGPESRPTRDSAIVVAGAVQQRSAPT